MRHILLIIAAVLGFSGQTAVALTVTEGEVKQLTPEQSVVPIWVPTRFDAGDQAGRDVCVPFLAAMSLTGLVSTRDCLLTIASVNERAQLDVIGEGEVLWLPAMNNDANVIQASLQARLANKALAGNPLGQVVQALQSEVATLKKSQLTEGAVKEIVGSALAATSPVTRFELDEVESGLLQKIDEAVVALPKVPGLTIPPVPLVTAPTTAVTKDVTVEAVFGRIIAGTALWQEYVLLSAVVLALFSGFGVLLLWWTKASKKSVKKSVDAVQTAVTEVKRLAVLALETAQFSCELQMSGLKFVGNLPSQADLDLLEPGHSFAVRLKEDSFEHTLMFVLEADPFKTGKPGLRVEGFPSTDSRRSAIALRREQVAKLVGDAVKELQSAVRAKATVRQFVTPFEAADAPVLLAAE